MSGRDILSRYCCFVVFTCYILTSVEKRQDDHGKDIIISHLKYPGNVVCDGLVIDCIVDHNLEGLKSSPALPERPKSVQSFADSLKNALNKKAPALPERPKYVPSFSDRLKNALNKKDLQEVKTDVVTIKMESIPKTQKDLQEVKTDVVTIKMETIPETQRDLQEIKTDVATIKMETIPETQRDLQEVKTDVATIKIETQRGCKEVQSPEDTNQINNFNMLLVYQRRLNKENNHCFESWKQILFWSIEKNHDLLCRYILANGQILNDNIEVWMSALGNSIGMQNYTCSKAIAWHITKRFAKSLSSLEEVFDIWPGFVCRCSAGMELKREHFCSRNVVIVVEVYNEKPNGFPDCFHNYQIQYKIMNGYSEEGKSVVLETNRMYSDSEPKTLPEGIKSKVAETYFQNYSKLFLISPSLLKSKCFKTNQQFDQMPCIQLYCRIKGIIPIGEAHFPTSISSVPTDVLEGHAHLLVKSIRIGSEIGQIGGGSGTLGGFVQYNGKDAFITCAHVLISKESLFKSTERKKMHQQTVYIQYINQGETGPPTLCGKLDSYRFPPDCSRDGTSVDAAIVKLKDSKVKIDPNDVLLDNGIHRTFGDFGMQSVYLNDNFVDYKHFGTAMPLTSRSAGIVSGIQELTERVCCDDKNDVKFEELSQVLDRMLIKNPKPQHVTEAVHIKEQIRKIDESTNEFPSSVTFYNQISFCNISFRQGDSGTCIYVADSSNTVAGCIGMAIASHPNGGCIITPLKAILSAFKMI